MGNALVVGIVEKIRNAILEVETNQLKLMEFIDVIQNVSSSQRIEKLKSCRKSPDFGKSPIHINGQQRFLDVYEIPLELLRFNTKNGRILMEIASLNEATGERSIDVDDMDSQKLIFKALWESNIERNTRTLEDLEEKDQQVPGCDYF
jgi:hypothetical protein